MVVVVVVVGGACGARSSASGFSCSHPSTRPPATREIGFYRRATSATTTTTPWRWWWWWCGGWWVQCAKSCVRMRRVPSFPLLLERCPPRQKSRVERFKAEVQPLLTSVTVQDTTAPTTRHPPCQFDSAVRSSRIRPTSSRLVATTCHGRLFLPLSKRDPNAMALNAYTPEPRTLNREPRTFKIEPCTLNPEP